MILKSKVQSRTIKEPRYKSIEITKKKKEPSMVQKRTIKKGSTLNHKRTNHKTTENKEVVLYSSNEVQNITIEKLQVLDYYQDKKSEITEVLEWFKNIKEKEVNANVHNLVIDHKELKGNTITRSFRLYEKIAKKLDKFTEQNKELKVIDIVNQAIAEFLDKYKK